MSTKTALNLEESYWAAQRHNLKGARRSGANDQSRLSKAAVTSRHSHASNAAGRQHSSSRTGGNYDSAPSTPTRLPSIDTDPVRERYQSPNLRRSKYDVIPPLNSHRSLPGDLHDQTSDGYDSWGDGDWGSNDGDEEDEPYSFHPYPVLMYPVVVSPRRKSPAKASRRRARNRRVHYRNTPTYLSSRDNYTQNKLYQESGVSPRLSYISTDRNKGGNILSDVNTYQSNVDLPRSLSDKSPTRVALDTDYNPKRSPEGATDHSRQVASDIIEDVVDEEGLAAVRQIVREHAKNDDVRGARDMKDQRREDDAKSAVAKYILEDIIRHDLLDPEVLAQSREVAAESLRRYSDRHRSKNVKEVEKHVRNRGIDGLFLDYLLSITSRQGRTTAGDEEASRVLDDHLLTLLMHHAADVDKRRRAGVDNKPLRRLHEKMVTDAALDVLLNEVSQSLNEDMDDLDEYERGLENPELRLPSELQRWLDGV